MKRLGLAALILALVAGCESGLERPVREVTAQVGSDQIQRVKVIAHSFYFDPNRIVVKRGVPVELTVKNGAMFVPHNLSCEAQEAGIEVFADVGMFYGSKTVRFTPTQTGEFHFFCHVDGHAKKGMTGTLVVVEP